MLPLGLGLPLAIISLVGVLINAYIVLVVVLTKQVSANNILLFHLGVVNALLCTMFLVFSVPSIARNDGHSAFGGESLMCTVHGVLMTTAHPVALWTICCLNCDRYYAIAAPLHYGAIVNTKKVVLSLTTGWLLALILCVPPFFSIAPLRYDPHLGACAPHFASGASSLWYAIIFTVTTLVVPTVLIIGCNIRVLMIARYHRHRIASAIYEVTLSAQVTITHQRNPFFVPIATPPKLRSRSPVATVLQLIGTVLVMYCPYYVTILWNSSAASLVDGREPITVEAAHPTMMVIAASLLACSPCVNGLLYGVKSKIMRKTFQNYWRKQKTKNEMCQEIQARTPSTCGSRRPSLTTLAVFNRPIPQRRLSETFFDHEKPLMKRIASEISWRPSSLTFADLNESPAMSPVTPNATPIPHTSSCNTLQIPHKVNEETDLGTTDADREHFADVKNSFRPGGPSHTPLVHSYHSGGTGHPTRNSLTSATSALIHKMLRIDIRDDAQSQQSSLTAEDSLILRSPRILITRAYSENDHLDLSPTTNAADAADLESVAYTWPSPLKDADADISDDDDDETAEEDYSRLLAAAASSMSASNSTTLSSVSGVRPFSSMDDNQLSGHAKNSVAMDELPRHGEHHVLLSSWPSAKDRSDGIISHPSNSIMATMCVDRHDDTSTETVVVRPKSAQLFHEQRQLTDIVL